MRDLFKDYFRPTEQEFAQMWQEAVFVFDTNVLLNLYRYTPNTRDELLVILEKLESRIWFPYHVGLEFARNRVSVISEQNKILTLINAFDAFVNEKFKKEIIQKFGKRGHFFADLSKINTIFENAKKELQEELQRTRLQHPDPLEHDVVLDRLEKLFKTRIGSPYTSEEMSLLEKEFENRYAQEIPPGFKDAGKKSNHVGADQSNPANKYGDVIIWYQMIEYAKQKRCPIIFVLDDVKKDWWEEVNGKKIGPQTALRLEMREKANTSFYMYTADSFIRRAKDYLQVQVKQETIEEVRDNRIQEEKKKVESQSVYNSFPGYGSLTGIPSVLSPSILTEMSRQNQVLQSFLNSVGGIQGLNRSFQQQQQLYSQLRPFLPYQTLPRQKNEDQEDGETLQDRSASDTADGFDQRELDQDQQDQSPDEG